MSKKKDNKDKFEPMGTKVSPDMAAIWNEICQSLGTDTYHMLQWFIYAMVRASSQQHSLTPDIQRLMTWLESDSAWQQSINLCAPNGKSSIAQMVLILEQKDKKGFAAVMLDKPFMEDARQTYCVDDIVERVIEVCMKGVYRRLRNLATDMDCKSMSDLLITMTDAQTVLNLDEENKGEMPGYGCYSDYGDLIEYGKRTKRKHHKSPDDMPSIQFGDYDKEIADYEAQDWEGEHIGDHVTPDEIEDILGGKPFGCEP